MADHYFVGYSSADALLAQTAQLYAVLDSKGLALAGLALCAAGEETAERHRVSSRNSVSEAVTAYRAARAITTAPGIVQRALRLFDALAVADAAGISPRCGRR